MRCRGRRRIGMSVQEDWSLRDAQVGLPGFSSGQTRELRCPRLSMD